VRFLRNGRTDKVHRAGCPRATGTDVEVWVWADRNAVIHGLGYIREICAGFNYTECGFCLPLTGGHDGAQGGDGTTAQPRPAPQEP
jgi:hypothetical protein